MVLKCRIILTGWEVVTSLKLNSRLFAKTYTQSLKKKQQQKQQNF